MPRHCSMIIVSLSLLLPLTAYARPFVLIISQDDLSDDPSLSSPLSSDDDWDGFHDDGDGYLSLSSDPGSWGPIFDPDDQPTSLYHSSVGKFLSSVGTGDVMTMEEAAEEMEAAAEEGDPNGQSGMGFIYGTGTMRGRDKGKGFLYHFFGSLGGNLHSKLFLAYTYFSQHMYEDAVVLYSELAELAVNSFHTSKDHAVLEPVRIHDGAEENKEALRKSRGEEDEDFQISEYQAEKGNAVAMYRMGVFYYFGLRGLRRDYSKALFWVLKAVEKGEPRSMELLGEMYAKGAGVERNFTKSFLWLKRASRQHLYSANNGIGYLYVKGYGVEEKNFTKAKEYFEKAADNEDAGGNYNLGVMYLKGIGVKRDIKLACKYFTLAANGGQPKAFFQLAKMFHTGVGLKKNIPTATALYKLVAERGPWSSLSRWALESYLKGEVGKALFLYSKMSELGYEVGQSNAAWILDRYGKDSMCIGESGLCTDSERYIRAHSLWWQASEQGNEHAALLIGDTYYYGRGTDRDYDRAAKAYMHAKSQSNAQAMFNLGYMHEHGQGLPLDLHLAKRYYDQALEFDRTAKLPVTIALACLWMRTNYANSVVVDWIDSLPEMYSKVDAWVQDLIMEEGNVTILTLFICLLTVLYLRERQRRHVAAAGGNVAPLPQPHIRIPRL